MQLFLDARHITFDGFHAQMQLVRDLARAVTVSEKLEDDQFAVAEIVHGQARREEWPALASLRIRASTVSLTWISPSSTRRMAWRIFSAPSAFGDVPARASAEGALGVKRLVMHGENQHGQAFVTGL